MFLHPIIILIKISPISSCNDIYRQENLNLFYAATAFPKCQILRLFHYKYYTTNKYSCTHGELPNEILKTL